METINSMASAAAKAVWGESNDSTTTSNKEIHEPGTTTTTNMSTTNETQGQEPISGKLGDTSKGEPFDAGNIGTIFFFPFRSASHEPNVADKANPSRIW